MRVCAEGQTNTQNKQTKETSARSLISVLISHFFSQYAADFTFSA